MKQHQIKVDLSLEVFDRANRAKLNYALLRNYLQVLDGTGKDLDVLIEPGDRGLFIKVIRESLRTNPDWMVFQIIQSRYGSIVVLLHRDNFSLIFDLQSTVNFGTGLAPAKYFLDRSFFSGEGIRRLERLAYLTTLFLHNEIKSKPEYSDKLEAAFKETPGLEREVREKIVYLRKRFSIGPVRKIWRKISAVSALRRYLSPAGLFVVVNGPDGVGKTTALLVLQDNLTSMNIIHRIKHLGGKTGMLPGRPASLPRKHSPENLRRSAASDSKSLLGRIFDLLRFIYHFLDISLYYWLVIRRFQASGGLFIADKYFTYTIKAGEMGFSVPVRLVNRAYHLLPRPDLFILFWNTPEVIVSRKQELTPREAALHIKRLAELGLYSRRREKIKTDGTITSVADRVLRCVADYLRDRSGR